MIFIQNVTVPTFITFATNIQPETVLFCRWKMYRFVIMMFTCRVFRILFCKFDSRPPPKFIRRAAPVEPPTVPTSSGGLHTKKESDSAPSSLERNIKPSEILRQKSSDSLDVKLASSYRKTTPDLSKQSDLATEFGQKIKAESLEKNRRPDIS